MARAEDDGLGLVGVEEIHAAQVGSLRSQAVKRDVLLDAETAKSLRRNLTFGRPLTRLGITQVSLAPLSLHHRLCYLHIIIYNSLVVA